MLWEVHDVSTRVATLDLRESGQGRWDATQLLFDGVVVSNALHLVDWRSEPIQVRLCESCGKPGCRDGDWVVLRRILDRLVVLPAFEHWREEGAHMAPPTCMQEHSIPVVAGPTLPAPLRVLPAFPELEMPTGPELRRLLQFCAPGGFLGRWPEPVGVDRAVPSYCSDDLQQRCNELERLVGELPESVSFHRIEPAEAPVTFGFYTPDWCEWEPLVQTSNGVLLSPLPGVVLR